MKKPNRIFGGILSICIFMGTMAGITVQADAAAYECMVADFGDAATVDAVAGSRACMSKSTQITYNGANSSLEVTAESNNGFYVYKKDADNKLVGLAPKEKDVSGYKYFRMRIYSQNSGDAFRVSISTTGEVDGSYENEFRYTLKTRGTGWQEVALPLSAAEAGPDANWSNIAGVYLKSGSGIGSTPAGHKIYIDKIWFGNTAGEAINAGEGQLVVADFGDSQTAAAKQAQASNYLTVEDNLTVIPGKTSLRWSPTSGNQLPTMAVNPIDVSEYKNVRIRFYSTDADKKFVLLATYKAETGISKNPYFYTVITSDGTGWQDVSIPEADFGNSGVRDIDDNGNQAAPSWDHIGGIFLQAGGWGTDSSSIAGKAVYIDSIIFEGKPKSPLMIADFSEGTVVDDMAYKWEFAEKSTDRTYRGALSSLKITKPENGNIYVADAELNGLGQVDRGIAFAPASNDLSEYKYFRMRIYSENEGDSLCVIVRSDSIVDGSYKDELRYKVTLTGKGWQEIAVPLSDFSGNENPPSWSNVGGVYLKTGAAGAEMAVGHVIYIDKIWFGDTDGSENKIEHLYSDELYINQVDGVINGFYGMTLTQVRNYLVLPDNTELAFYDSEGEAIVDENVAATSGIMAVLSNNEEYLLDVPLYEFKNARFNDSTIKTFSQGTLKVDLDAVC
ncbi:MAG: hypothetical protein SOS24_02810 [Clostridia bacterium]|nr:hypothetical protein [Clostridia bacterium]